MSWPEGSGGRPYDVEKEDGDPGRLFLVAAFLYGMLSVLETLAGATATLVVFGELLKWWDWL